MTRGDPGTDRHDGVSAHVLVAGVTPTTIITVCGPERLRDLADPSSVTTSARRRWIVVVRTR